MSVAPEVTGSHLLKSVTTLCHPCTYYRCVVQPRRQCSLLPSMCDGPPEYSALVRYSIVYDTLPHDDHGAPYGGVTKCSRSSRSLVKLLLSMNASRAAVVSTDVCEQTAQLVPTRSHALAGPTVCMVCDDMPEHIPRYPVIIATGSC